MRRTVKWWVYNFHTLCELALENKIAWLCQDAVKYMDGEKLDGTKITVSRADNRPPIRNLAASQCA